MNPARNIYDQLGDDIAAWIDRTHKDELGKLIQKYPSDKNTFVVDWDELFSFNPALAEDSIKNPDAVREAIRYCLKDIVPQNALVDRTEEGADGQKNVVRAEQVSVIFTNVSDPMSVSELIRGDDISDLVTLRGKCTKATDTRPKPTVAALRCPTCGIVSKVPQPTHGSDSPNQCKSCEARNPDWKPELSDSEWEYHQLVRIKHEPGETESDSHIDVHLTGDMAGSLSGGESVDISGVLDDVWPDGLDSGMPDFILEADTVRKHESDFESIDVMSHKDRVKELASGSCGDPYELLKDSIAPGIHGDETMDRIKLSLACQLFGAPRIENSDGTGFRGDIHQLLVGGPGTGKSSLMDAVAEYSPKVATISGKNASKAGVTAAAVRDDFGDTEWSIEAGAFVQANKGLCIVDELDKVEGDVLSSLHSALERQQLSVAKAGITADLQCQTSLLGAANPVHERFIDEQKYIEQIPVGSAMRTRLDTVFVLTDSVDPESDEQKVESMLNSIASGDGVETVNFDDDERVEPSLETDEIQAWVAYARQHHTVAFDMDVLKKRIKSYYGRIREKSADTGAPVNIRKVGSILRYSIASARIRLGDKVNESDIDRAIGIVSTSLAQIGMTDDGRLSDDSGVVKQVTQASRKEQIKTALHPTEEQTPAEIAEQVNCDEKTVRDELEEMAKGGDVLRPKTGLYRSIE